MANSNQSSPDVTKKYFSMNRVCSAAKDSVRVMKIRQFFELAQTTPFYIPLFQRRYCWDASHWKKLLQDILKQTWSTRAHAFNRMQTARKRSDRIEVIDGQQRLTTFSIFLAAVRDTFTLEPAFVAEINNLLFPGGIPEDMKELSEGAMLGSSVIPGYYDRLPFYVATLPGTSDSPDLTDQITLAYRYYCTELKKLPSNITAQKLLSALLDNCTMLNFGVNDKDILEVYEMMVVHNHTWGAVGAAMAESDLIKNFFLSQFESEETQVRFYTEYWLRLEDRLVSGGDQTRTFDKMFRAFIRKYGLEEQNDEKKQKFDLYNDVQKVVFDYVSKQVGTPREDALFELLHEVLKFCKTWIAAAKSDVPIKAEESVFSKSA